MIEIVLILGLIIIGLLGILAVVIANISGGEASKKMIVAANLAREGVEVVRQIRDNNWLDCGMQSGGVYFCASWDDGLLDGAETPATAAIAIFNANIADGERYNTWNLFFIDRGQYSGNNFGNNSTRVYLNTETGLYLQDTGQTCSINSDCLSGNCVAGICQAPGSPTIYSRLIRLNEICSNGESGEDYEEKVAYDDQTCDDFSSVPIFADFIEKVGIQIKSEVRWLERDKQRSIIAEDKIYNWR